MPFLGKNRTAGRNTSERGESSPTWPTPCLNLFYLQVKYFFKGLWPNPSHFIRISLQQQHMMMGPPSSGHQLSKLDFFYLTNLLRPAPKNDPAGIHPQQSEHSSVPNFNPLPKEIEIVTRCQKNQVECTVQYCTVLPHNSSIASGFVAAALKFYKNLAQFVVACVPGLWRNWPGCSSNG